MEFQAFEIGVVGLGDFWGLVIWPRLGCVHTVWPWEISLVSHLSLTWFVGNKDLGYSYFYIALPVTVCLWCTVWMPLGAVDLHIVICWLVGLNSVAGWLRLGIDSCGWPILTNQRSPALSHSIMGHPVIVLYWGLWLCDFHVGCWLCRFFLASVTYSVGLVVWPEAFVRHDREFMSPFVCVLFYLRALTWWPATRLGLDLGNFPVMSEQTWSVLAVCFEAGPRPQPSSLWCDKHRVQIVCGLASDLGNGSVHIVRKM